jgi:hypothetical protein
MRKPTVHKQYCFAGEPAACPGYFTNDALPCVCGANGNALAALSQVAMPIVPLEETTPYIHLMKLSA